MFLVVGSQALKWWSAKDRINYVADVPRHFDWDVICDMEDFQEWEKAHASHITKVMPIRENKFAVLLDNDKPWEFEIALPGNSAHLLLDMVEDGTYKVGNECGMMYANPWVVYLLKMSHRFLKNSPHFYKTMADIRHQRMLEDEQEPWMSPKDSEFIKLREKETYWYKHPSLNQKKDTFFSGDGVEYIYDHDDIHKAVAHLAKPAYEYYKMPGEEVKCSKKLFDLVPRETRIFGVMEEAYTLALERSQIPIKHGKFKDSTWTPHQSFKFALMKVCTSITSGWFREFAWENHDTVLAMYDRGYADRFWRAVEEGKVAKYSGSKY